MRLGVSAAIVDGVHLAGDVEVDPANGTVVAVGLAGARGTGVACPGLVDLQVNGFAGVDFAHAEPEEVLDAAAAMSRRGVTAFCPTLYSLTPEGYERSLRVIDIARRTSSAGPYRGTDRGARLLGAHLEGPFLARSRHGAHDAARLLDPDPRLTARLLGAGRVAMMTLAPELEGAIELIRTLRAAGVVTSLGHSAADAATTRAALDAGAQHVTHLWNAQRPPTARDPGLVGTALSDDRVVVGVIADRRHVSPEVLTVTMRCCPGRLAATSDAIAAAGAPGPEGNPTAEPLLGGLVAVDTCLRTLVELGQSLPSALDACGGVQRALLGLPPVRLLPGDPADIVVLDDTLQPVRTLIRGSEVAG